MILNGVKYACDSCIRGHRASSCNHSDRKLNMVRRKGRPPTQCHKCRELRRTRKAHVKCLCAEMKAGEYNLPTIMSAPETPNKIESLLNPCQCKDDSYCTCCKPKFSAFLSRAYSPRVVEQTARSLSQSLRHPSVSEPVTPVGIVQRSNVAAVCPSGPAAPCCKTEPSTRTGSLSKDYSMGRMLSLPMGRPMGQRPPHVQIPGPWTGVPQRPSGSIQLPPLPATARAPERTEGLAEHMERPSCGCGCDCSKRLDMLIQAIESRIGLGRPLAPAVRPTGSDRPIGSDRPMRMDRGDAEWAMRLLPPRSHERPLASARTLQPVPSVRHRTLSTGSLTHSSLSAPQTARQPSFGQFPAPNMTRERSSSHSSTLSTASTVRALPQTSGPEQSVGRKRSGFAEGIVPPIVSSAWQQPSLPSVSQGSTCCAPKVPAVTQGSNVPAATQAPNVSTTSQVPNVPATSQAPNVPATTQTPNVSATSQALKVSNVPQITVSQDSKPDPCKCPQTAQQALPGMTCCDTKQSTTACCNDKTSSCACCKKAGWVPGTASNAHMDGDGALACSCGCHKPFGECTDCIKDNCESLLYKSIL
ncbi:copper-binding transcription factor [Coemansia sp. RSA 532]|nr:copper-binding transcription factor [Coemansia sp. RSA 532]KAJ2282619.1 copper-binding transcription factor [Coemansia sp. RSA 370]KAJ2290709.1 copper-binding transcription factor [Coemansia sp. RSA 355]KAJ2409349.1 copper-binding transcription factor [Coemansia sp. RSA 2526]